MNARLAEEAGGIDPLPCAVMAAGDDAAALEASLIENVDASDPLIEALGTMLSLDMATVWQADDALLDLIRDRATLGSILTEVAGEAVATGNASATGKVKRQIVRDCVTGSNGRVKVDGWVPRWMAFPATSYAAVPSEAEVIPLPVAAQPLARAA